MNVIRPWLAVGGFSDTRDRQLLMDEGVGAVLTLERPVDYDGIETLYLPIEDGVTVTPEVLREGVGFVLDQKEKRHGVLSAWAPGLVGR